MILQRCAAKNRQGDHPVSHVPLQDRYTFNYISNVQTTTTKKNKKQNKFSKNKKHIE